MNSELKGWQPAHTAPENGDEFWYWSRGHVRVGSLGGSIKRDPEMIMWHPKSPNYFGIRAELPPAPPYGNTTTMEQAVYDALITRRDELREQLKDVEDRLKIEDRTRRISMLKECIGSLSRIVNNTTETQLQKKLSSTLSELTYEYDLLVKMQELRQDAISDYIGI